MSSLLDVWLMLFIILARSISEEFSSGDGGRYRDEEYSQPHAPRDRQDKANKDKEDRDEGI